MLDSKTAVFFMIQGGLTDESTSSSSFSLTYECSSRLGDSMSSNISSKRSGEAISLVSDDRKNEEHTPSGPARIAFFSARHLNSHVCRCWGYELENIVTSMDDAEILTPTYVRPRKSKWEGGFRRILERAFGIRYYSRPWKVKPICSSRNRYEVLFAFCQEVNDLRHLECFSNWKNSARITACWVDELWLDYAKAFPKQVDLVRQFDFVFMNFRETCDFLRQQGINAIHVPPGVDSLRFSPYPDPPTRVIDVLSMGRKAERTHESLLRHAEQGRFYVYDTSNLPNVSSASDHRLMMANNIKRSKFFLVQKAKADEPNQTKGQVEVGSRFFEGCAGGAVLVGDPPDCPTFHDQFDWQDAVIHLPFDSQDVSMLFDTSTFSPERMAAIHRQNSIQSLRRHDWAYRWEFVLNELGIEPSEKLATRKRKLAQLADSIEFYSE